VQTRARWKIDIIERGKRVSSQHAAGRAGESTNNRREGREKVQRRGRTVVSHEDAWLIVATGRHLVIGRRRMRIVFVVAANRLMGRLFMVVVMPAATQHRVNGHYQGQQECHGKSHTYILTAIWRVVNFNRRL
jgi:hypothetical protein